MGVATLTAVGLMLAAAMVAAITLPNKVPKPELPLEAEQQPLAREKSVPAKQSQQSSRR
jgi:hypothetical protein